MGMMSVLAAHCVLRRGDKDQTAEEELPWSCSGQGWKLIGAGREALPVLPLSCGQIDKSLSHTALRWLFPALVCSVIK